MKNVSKLAVAVAIGAFTSLTAHAVPYTFSQITANGNTDVGSQLLVDVVASGSDVTFNFSNSGPTASSITDIYFDDDNLMAALLSFNEGAGVNFSAGASPGNLPGGNTISPAFVATAALSSDSDAPVSANGVGVGETLGITFSLLSGKTYSDVLADLNSGDLRVGLHVQAIAPQGGSESYVNKVNVPDAATGGAMMAVAFAMLAWARRQIA